ncbi:unnamed protein product [Musa textilis]
MSPIDSLAVVPFSSKVLHHIVISILIPKQYHHDEISQMELGSMYWIMTGQDNCYGYLIWQTMKDIASKDLILLYGGLITRLLHAYNVRLVLGWLNPSFPISWLYGITDFCFERYGDRVKNWFTFNEPRVVSALGYDSGFFAPERCTNCKFGGNSTIEPYIITHNLILSHAAAVKRYHEKY